MLSFPAPPTLGYRVVNFIPELTGLLFKWLYDKILCINTFFPFIRFTTQVHSCKHS